MVAMRASILNVRARPKTHDELNIRGLKDSLHVEGIFGYKHPQMIANRIQPFGTVRNTFEIFRDEFENFIQRDVPHRKKSQGKGTKRKRDFLQKELRELKRQFTRVEDLWKRQNDHTSVVSNSLLDSESESETDSQ